MVHSKSNIKTLNSLSKLFLSFSLLLYTAIVDDGVFMSKLAKSLTPTPSGWMATTFCSWNGVKCDGFNRVTSINLASKSLNGTLPSDLKVMEKVELLNQQVLAVHRVEVRRKSQWAHCCRT
ncbi:unnamed protein product [Lathyrus sativus]|nr:unnamed protein product [Lathyrus sativus]